MTTLDWRTFLAGLGATASGLALGLIDGRVALAAPVSRALRPNRFVHLALDGTLSIVCHRSEMGQGVRSSLPALVAAELGADLARLRVVQADGDPAYGDQNTDGSRSVRAGFLTLRRLGAAARTMLVEVAAARWGVPPTECVAHHHAVWHTRSERAVAFADLVADAAQRAPPAEPRLRPDAELKEQLRTLRVVDAADVVAGRATYAADVQVPGMLTAVVARPPVLGGRPARYDPSRALAVPGVRAVVEVPRYGLAPGFRPVGGLAVVADHTWAALQGRRALAVEWDDGPNADYDSARFREALLATVRAPQQVVRRRGDVEAALKGAATRVSAEYYVPHLAHATMEPPAAVAHTTGTRCEVWACTQDPQGARAEVAAALLLDEAAVTVHVTLLGGGFGRKSKPDFIVEAALLSRELKAPVRVQWTREDDLRHDYYHTVSAQRFDAALGADGAVQAWRHRTAFPSIGSTFVPVTVSPTASELGQGATDVPLAVPNVQVEAGTAKAQVRVGWMRSVCNIFHGFGVGCFVDELAHARGRDPLATWLELVGPPRKLTPEEAGLPSFSNYGEPLSEHPIDVGRYREVIERVGRLAGWGTPQEGRALGLAAHRSFNAAVAVVVAVKLRPNGTVAVDEAWVAADVGTVVNRDRVVSQLEGAVVFGQSLALHGRISVARGRVEQAGFRDYRLARIGDTPRRITVDLVDSDAPPAGVGEPGVPPVAPAIANALFALTGKRYRELPLTRGGLLG